MYKLFKYFLAGHISECFIFVALAGSPLSTELCREIDRGRER